MSHHVAQFTETVLVFLLAVGAYAFSRPCLASPARLGLALMTIEAPELSHWGRQVMLDIPAYALGLIGMVWVCSYIRSGSPRYVYLAVAFLLAAIHTKFNVAFLLVSALAATLMARADGSARSGRSRRRIRRGDARAVHDL